VVCGLVKSSTGYISFVIFCLICLLQADLQSHRYSCTRDYFILEGGSLAQRGWCMAF
jgi:hypothetical protein